MNLLENGMLKIENYGGKIMDLRREEKILKTYQSFWRAEIMGLLVEGRNLEKMAE